MNGKNLCIITIILICFTGDVALSQSAKWNPFSIFKLNNTLLQASRKKIKSQSKKTRKQSKYHSKKLLNLLPFFDLQAKARSASHFRGITYRRKSNFSKQRQRSKKLLKLLPSMNLQNASQSASHFRGITYRRKSNSSKENYQSKKLLTYVSVFAFWAKSRRNRKIFQYRGHSKLYQIKHAKRRDKKLLHYRATTSLSSQISNNRSLFSFKGNIAITKSTSQNHKKTLIVKKIRPLFQGGKRPKKQKKRRIKRQYDKRESQIWRTSTKEK